MNLFRTQMEEFTFVSVLLRLLLAALAGGAVGLERESKRRPAGFRTYMLTSLGAALTMLLGIYNLVMIRHAWLGAAAAAGAATDIGRFPAQVINGIGFLAAGTILVSTRQHVSGLTTASGLFVSAAMGIAAGAGFIICVLITIPLVLLVMVVLPKMEERIQEQSRYMNLYVQIDSAERISDVVAVLKNEGVEIFEIDVGEKNREAKQTSGIILDVGLPVPGRHAEIISYIGMIKGVGRVEEV